MARAHGRSPNSNSKTLARRRRSREFKLQDFVEMQLQIVAFGSVLERERQVLELRRHPWCGELHWRLTLRLYELADDADRLLQAREILIGERRRAYLAEIEPPRRPVAPSEEITATGRVIADVLGLLVG